MKKITLLLTGLFLLLNLFSQDQISFKSGKEVQSTIVSFDSSEIVYYRTRLGFTKTTSTNISKIASFEFNGSTYYMRDIEKQRLNTLKKEIYDKQFHLADSAEKAYSSFYYTNRNNIIGCDEIILKKPFLGSNYLLVNSTDKYDPKTVKFYKNHDGFYARIVNQYTLSKSFTYAERVSRGYINVFEKVTYTAGGPYNPGQMKVDHYYNIGFSEPKYASYLNLLYDLEDCPASIDLLKKSNRKRMIGNGIAAAGVLSVVSGLVFALTAPDGDPQDNPEVRKYYNASYISMGIGVGCMAIGYVFNLSRDNYIFEAIDAYNHQKSFSY